MSWVKVGVIVPSSNTTVEREFNKIFVEPDVTIHSARITLREVNLKGLEEMEKETERAAAELRTANVDVIAYACTTGSLFKGPKHHEEIKQRIEGITGIKAVATAGAVLDALKHLNARNVLVVTPYIDELNVKEREFLEANGFRVIDIKGLGIVDNTVIGALDPRTAYEAALNAVRQAKDEFDALFISCTNWRTFEIINQLEKGIGKPVISSNSATLWSVIRALDIKVKLRFSLGTLFGSFI
jgi:Maleate cis-trans isomerase